MPTYSDMRLERHKDDTFPTHHVFNRLGSLEDRVQLLRDYATKNEEFSELRNFLPDVGSNSSDVSAPSNLTEGFVYLGLMKVGREKRFKIGKAVLTDRRLGQIGPVLPEELVLVHHIATDDAFGIEAYWHKRFADKNTRGEWFALSENDVRAFKRRKFM